MVAPDVPPQTRHTGETPEAVIEIHGALVTGLRTDALFEVTPEGTIKALCSCSNKVPGALAAEKHADTTAVGKH